VPAKSIDISNNGNLLAIGCKNGETKILDTNLKEVRSIRNKKEVSIVKFSPNNQYLCVGIAPPVSKVFIYDASNGFKAIG
jgi:WD40 repeat protein